MYSGIVKGLIVKDLQNGDLLFIVEDKVHEDKVHHKCLSSRKPCPQGNNRLELKMSWMQKL